MSSPPPSPPSPSPSAPLKDFEGLTLESEMSSSTADIRSRALKVRDILSSFDRDVLPSELKPHIYTELDRPSNSRPPVTQWTIQEDLSGTLLQWGAYNEEAFELLTSLQSPSTLARCFYEKIRRRFQRLFDEYDRLSDEYSDTIRSEIPRIAGEFRSVVAAIREDRMYRDLGQEAIAARMLDALIGICRRHADLVPAQHSPVTPRRGTRRTTSLTEGPTSLYEALITRPITETSEGPFMLDVLETFPSDVFTELQSEFSILTSLLDINGAPAPYKYRIGRLQSVRTQTASARPQSKGLDESSDPERTSGAPAAVDSTSLTEAQPQARQQKRRQAPAPITTSPITRSKRTADEISPILRRGKKKT